METYNFAHRIFNDVKVKSRVAILNLLKIRNARKFLNKDFCQIVVQGLVISHLDYCNSLRIGIPDDTLKHFERILVMSVKTILSRISSLRLVRLTWKCIGYQLNNELNIANNIAHKALYGIASRYITDFLTSKPVLHEGWNQTRKKWH